MQRARTAVKIEALMSTHLYCSVEVCIWLYTPMEGVGKSEIMRCINYFTLYSTLLHTTCTPKG